MVSVSDYRAPGALEAVRELLNTVQIPNDTREQVDLLTGSTALRALRDDLRTVVEGGEPDRLDGWIAQLRMVPTVDGGVLGFRGRGDGADVLAAVLDAIGDGTWSRLKACPDCRFVFYDHTRNASKRWCVMTAGSPQGRSCGSIAKVRAHRQRSRTRETDTLPA